MSRRICLLVLAVCFGFVAHAQPKADFVEYTKLPELIMKNLKEAQREKAYASIEVLREKSASALDSKGLGLKVDTKASKKAMPAFDLVPSVKKASLMFCKYKRGFGAYDDFILIGATAVAIREDGLCVTNYHVLETIIDQEQGIHPQDSLMFIADLDGNTFEIEEVLAYNQLADLAIFKVNVGKHKLQPFKLGEDPLVGMHVNALTNPIGVPYYYSEGIVARNVAYDGNPWENRTEISAEFAIGSSGGPIFDDCGNLVAIVSSTDGVYAQNNDGRDLQMVIRMTIPISSVKRLLE
ncbi:S1 family peptidase [Mangrovibacterium diazotrophicum]|uniref:Trypsin-like peptidase n=1 Tax=Mangrovibacterium diazotrophicum TaxID=1261403 RepID=A0A419VXI4_9BACT|nr:serine protease [Mangrovibacterium diazotrophicum]RKD87889.1 trypsin-like peptidase [Mangrovibacterium diazotrophicum]